MKMTEGQRNRQAMAVRILRLCGYQAFCKFLATNVVPVGLKGKA